MIIDDMFPMLLEATWTNENRYVSGVSVGGGVVYMC